MARGKGGGRGRAGGGPAGGRASGGKRSAGGGPADGRAAAGGKKPAGGGAGTAKGGSSARGRQQAASKPSHASGAPGASRTGRGSAQRVSPASGRSAATAKRPPEPGKPAPASKRSPEPGKPAPGRPAPAPSPCPHSHECGACQCIELPYDRQLADKDACVAQLFAPLAPSGAVRPIIGMEHPFHYRDKVISPYAPGKPGPAPGKSGSAPAPGSRPPARGGAAHAKGGRGARPGARGGEILCGMYAAHSHRIVDTEGCLVENEQAKRIIRTVRDLMGRFGIEPYDEDAHAGFLRHAVVRVGHTSGEILVTLVTNGEAFPASKAFCRELVARCPQVTTVVQNINERRTNVILGPRERRLWGPGFILDELCGLSFRISSQSFYQVNAVQTEVLYRTAIELARLDGSQRVVDAYCGTGTIGLVAAKTGAREVVGVDDVESAVRDARQNAAHNGVDNARFVAADAGEFMRDLARDGEGADVLFMDPPRAGASEAFLRAAAELGCGRIVYISCNPQTQVRDVSFLLERGYVLRTVQPVDMFPHTDHIECVVELVRE